MFKFRSHKKELMDGENIPDEDLRVNLNELHIINKFLGGYKCSINGLKKVLKKDQPSVLVDLGCGGGSWLKSAYMWKTKNNYPLSLYGIDIKQFCIHHSIINNPIENGFIRDDYKNLLAHLANVDVLHAALFCHHLTLEEIVELIQFAVKNKTVLIINDLQRNVFAYLSIKLLTLCFSDSYLVKHDAPVSVLKGFKLHEWISMLEKGGAKKFSVKRKWAFRHQVIVYPC
jgi:2-polyprenyl-3-methyl-5-hydroxy-6-metoxy-1,4-benzoquinol methylase